MWGSNNIFIKRRRCFSVRLTDIVIKTTTSLLNSCVFFFIFASGWSKMEEASRSDEPNRNPNIDRSSNPNPLSSIISSAHVWPTIDGPLGLTEEASVDYARRFYKFGFALLPWLWAVNCFYFWPVLRHSRAFPQIRNCKFPQILFSIL